MTPKTEGQRALRANNRHHSGISGQVLLILAALLFSAVIVAACAPVPRAFEPGEEASVGEAIVHGTFTKGIQVNAVENTAPIMSKLLARTTVDSFEPYDVPAGVAPFDASEYILHGRAHYDKNPNAIPYWYTDNGKVKRNEVEATVKQLLESHGGLSLAGQSIERIDLPFSHPISA